MEISYSKSKLFKAILLGLSLTVGGAIVAVKGYYDLFLAPRSLLASYSVSDAVALIVTLVGVVGVLMFGGMTFVFISWLFRSEPQVIINLDGIEDKRLKIGLIEWNEIEAILLVETKHAAWLSLILKSPEKYYRRLPKFENFLRKLNGQKENNDLHIRFAVLNKTIDEAWAFIEDNVIKPREEKNARLASNRHNN